MIDVHIRTIRIHSVSDTGSVNVGTTINLISKKKCPHDQSDQAPVMPQTPEPKKPQVHFHCARVGDTQKSLPF